VTKSPKSKPLIAVGDRVLYFDDNQQRRMVVTDLDRNVWTMRAHGRNEDEIRVSRRDRARVCLEPAMSLDAARAVLTDEGATTFIEQGLIWFAHRPRAPRAGEQGNGLSTAVIRWVGNDNGTTPEERADAWEIQGGWTG
jgi:hypothetical protein